jgi:preprotein translocase subunit SecG
LKNLLLTTLLALSYSTAAHADDVLSLSQILLLVTYRLAYAFLENLIGILLTAFLLLALVLFVKHGLKNNEHDKEAMKKSNKHL